MALHLERTNGTVRRNRDRDAQDHISARNLHPMQTDEQSTERPVDVARAKRPPFALLSDVINANVFSGRSRRPRTPVVSSP